MNDNQFFECLSKLCQEASWIRYRIQCQKKLDPKKDPVWNNTDQINYDILKALVPIYHKLKTNSQLSISDVLNKTSPPVDPKHNSSMETKTINPIVNAPIDNTKKEEKKEGTTIKFIADPEGDALVEKMTKKGNKQRRQVYKHKWTIIEDDDSDI